MMSGQSFLELLRWHPRDVDTMEEHYQEQAEENRVQAQRQAVLAAMGGG